MSTMKIKLIVDKSNTVIVMRNIPKSNEYKHVLQFIRDKMDIKADTLKYVDDENYRVQILCDDDIRDAIETAQQRKEHCKIYVKPVAIISTPQPIQSKKPKQILSIKRLISRKKKTTETPKKIITVQNQNNDENNGDNPHTPPAKDALSHIIRTQKNTNKKSDKKRGSYNKSDWKITEEKFFHLDDKSKKMLIDNCNSQHFQTMCESYDFAPTEIPILQQRLIFFATNIRDAPEKDILAAMQEHHPIFVNRKVAQQWLNGSNSLKLFQKRVLLLAMWRARFLPKNYSTVTKILIKVNTELIKIKQQLNTKTNKHKSIKISSINSILEGIKTSTNQWYEVDIRPRLDYAMSAPAFELKGSAQDMMNAMEIIHTDINDEKEEDLLLFKPDNDNFENMGIEFRMAFLKFSTRMRLLKLLK
eukprot:216269_1